MKNTLNVCLNHFVEKTSTEWAELSVRMNTSVLITQKTSECMFCTAERINNFSKDE
jgi:hypothetical protein